MPLRGGICPNGDKKPLEYCINECQEDCHYPQHLLKDKLNRKIKDEYSFNVTDLTQPPQALYLDRIFDYYMPYWKLGFRTLGTGIHEGLEAQGHEKMTGTLQIGSYTFRGRPDYWNEKQEKIIDYKVTGLWTIKYIKKNGIMQEKEDWVYQLNMYNILHYVLYSKQPNFVLLFNPDSLLLPHELNGLKVKKLRVWYIVRDWKPRDLDDGYLPTGWLNIPILEEQEIKAWAKKKAEFLHDVLVTHAYPPCSKKDLWDRTDNMRCKFYCDVSDICSQYKGEK